MLRCICRFSLVSSQSFGKDPRIMVLINHYVLKTLNAYSTVPLTAEIVKTIQHGFYDGTYARYDNPQVLVDIHDRPDFHGKSHYDIRVALDNEGVLDPIIIADERTPHLDAVWYLEDTANCKIDSDPSLFKPGEQPVRYPGEDFVLWQAYMKTADAPSNWATWDVVCGDMQETLAGSSNWPYDPHNTHYKPLDLGVDWKDLNFVSAFWGPAYLRANWTEVEWSTDPDDRRIIPHPPPVVARLTAEAATANGLLQQWAPMEVIGPAGQEVDHLIAWYDWASPKWPTGYPDDLARPGLAASAFGALRSSNPTSQSSARQWLRKNMCAHIRQAARGGSNRTSITR